MKNEPKKQVKINKPKSNNQPSPKGEIERSPVGGMRWRVRPSSWTNKPKT